MPCNPFAMIRVLRPRPNRPKTPSCRMTSLAASAAHHAVSFADRDGVGRLTVGDLGIVDLAIGLDHPQGVGNTVRYNRGAEPDESQAGQPHDKRVLRGLFDVLRQEVVLPSLKNDQVRNLRQDMELPP